MSRPAEITLWDEIRSIQMYVRQEFTTDKIRIERPQEDVPYDILIEPPAEIMSDARGVYMTDETLPLTIQRWCTTYTIALTSLERLKILFNKGIGMGDKRRIPVWVHPLPGAPSPDVPDPDVDTPDRWLRVEDLSARILPSQTIGEYIVVVDLRLKGWRITHEHTDQLVEVVQKPVIEWP